MTEAALKRALCAELRTQIPGAVVLRHEDRTTSGIPDISVTRAGRVVWIEVKLHPYRATPLQERVLRHLGGLLVTYVSTDKDRKTLLRDYRTETHDWQTGLDHQWIAQQVKEMLNAE